MTVLPLDFTLGGRVASTSIDADGSVLEETLADEAILDDDCDADCVRQNVSPLVP